MWTLEYYDALREEWRNVYVDFRSWLLEDAIAEMRKEYETWNLQAGWIPGEECRVRLRNTVTSEAIPVELVM